MKWNNMYKCPKQYLAAVTAQLIWAVILTCSRNIWQIEVPFFPTGSVQLSCSVVSNTLQLHGLQLLGFPVYHKLLELSKFMSIELVIPSNHLILSHPLLLLPSIFPSIRVFSNESVLCIRWPKYWNFSFCISSFNEHSGLISFRIDRFDILTVQGTLKSLLQHYSSKASILWHSAFSIVQLSYPYVTTGKTIALTRWTFVGKVMSLLFNMLSRLVITFLSRSKHLLKFHGCRQHCSDFGVQESKIYHCFRYLPIYLPLNNGTRCHDLHFLNAEF